MEVNWQNDDGEDMDAMMEESACTDGFFVPDGQLSDDEGISSAQQGMDQFCADQLGKSFLYLLEFSLL